MLNRLYLNNINTRKMKNRIPVSNRFKGKVSIVTGGSSGSYSTLRCIICPSILAATIPVCVNTLETILKGCSSAELEKVFKFNALDFYQI